MLLETREGHYPGTVDAKSFAFLKVSIIRPLTCVEVCSDVHTKYAKTSFHFMLCSNLVAPALPDAYESVLPESS